MIQLAIESTGQTGSLALMRGPQVLKATSLPRRERTAASLAVALRQTLDWCESQNMPIDFVSVADGPGSFTGLRIGVTTAKVLCYAKGWPLTTVDSLAAIAGLVFFENPEIDNLLVATNAYRGQVFTGTFSRNLLMPLLSAKDVTTNSDPKRLEDWSAHPDTVTILDQSEWNSHLSQLPRGTTVAGDAKVFPSGSLSNFVTRKGVDAVGVALIAEFAARSNQWVDPMMLVPRYFRPSAAEEKANSG